MMPAAGTSKSKLGTWAVFGTPSDAGVNACHDIRCVQC